MAAKLSTETTLTIGAADLMAILTDHFCEGSYGAFSKLEAAMVGETSEGDFQITFYPKPKPEPKDGE